MWPASPLIKVGGVLVQVAGRVAGPVAGEDGEARLDLRRAPDARRCVEADARSIIWQLPEPPPWHGLKLFDISEGWIPTSLTRKVRPETVMFYMAKCDVFT
jgi:hypothetical protein